MFPFAKYSIPLVSMSVRFALKIKVTDYHGCPDRLADSFNSPLPSMSNILDSESTFVPWVIPIVTDDYTRPQFWWLWTVRDGLSESVRDDLAVASVPIIIKLSLCPISKVILKVKTCLVWLKTATRAVWTRLYRDSKYQLTSRNCTRVVPFRRQITQ